MKRIVLLFLITASFIAKGQVYNNEWIDYNKTYYKFKVAANGLYRIPQSTLSSIGLAAAGAEQYQLWRNGQQVPIYTSVASGAMGGNDYIEFWGEMNDGKPDNALYRNAAYQLNDHWSLQTDTAAYFLTVNAGGGNLRLTNTVNNVAGNTLAPEPYFMHTAGNYFKNMINAGKAENVGENLYSASYDIGEGWSTGNIGAGAVYSYTLNNLYVYTGGPDATLKYNASGNAINYRKIFSKINGAIIDTNQTMDFFNYVKASFNVPIATISSNTAVIEYANKASAADRMVLAQSELVYPRQFNFGGEKSFKFMLPASSTGNYLEIANFNFGSQAPVLYDITNGKRYVADITASPMIKIALAPSSTDRTLILVNEEASNITAITNISSRNFINYALPANQGDYLIVSNALLFTASDGSNPVESYRQYRNSAAGGNHAARIYEVDQLVDQFAFGIKKNPLALRNFVLYARANFSTNKPRFLFLLGKGVTYNQYRAYENNPDIERLDLVPTFGYPASDNLITSAPGSSQPLLPVGRLSAIKGDEIVEYLKKVKEYEQAQAFQSPLIKDKSWMKNVVHVVGASESGLQAILESYMSKYKKIIQDTLFGGNVYTFTKHSVDAVEQVNSVELKTLLEQGVSLLTYFGHSSSSTLEFNLDNPENYNNTGKYPIFFALGCNAGSFYGFNPLRFQTTETLSEKWVLSPSHGSIAFVASSHFGLVHYLDIYNTRNYTSLSKTHYGESLGEDMMETVRQIFNLTTENDYYARVHSEETILHGDPAIKLNTHAKPDYAIEEPMVKINPAFISIAETNFKISARIMNLGKAIGMNTIIETKRQYPDLTTAVIHRDTIAGIRYIDSLIITVPIDPLKDLGENKITVTVDPDNTVDELFENNNSVTKSLFIYQDEARPVYPYKYAVINKQNIKLVASTANPLSELKQYNWELDTTALFNSTFKKTKSITSRGGILEFDPGFSFQDSMVYYWRVSPAVTSGDPKWSESSFMYIANAEKGFSQAHYYQHLQSSLKGISLDSVSRRWGFDSLYNNIFSRNAVFPVYTSIPDFSVSINNDPIIAGGCYYDELIINVIDPATMKPWKNVFSGGSGLYNSLVSTCGQKREYNFEYSLSNNTGRKHAMDFLDLIPNGSIIVIRTNTNPNFSGNTYADVWKTDTTLYGSGNSLYHRFRANGFNEIDSFNRPRTFLFYYQKNTTSFKPIYVLSEGTVDKIALNATVKSPSASGTITSPAFGPAKEWKQLIWRGSSLESPSLDDPTIDVIGVDNKGIETLVIGGLKLAQQDYDISSINTVDYPYVKLRMKNVDTGNYSPYQLKYWRVLYTPVPEGAIAPNVFFEMKDTLDVGQPLAFKLAFKNISEPNFDSIKIKLIVTDRNNVPLTIPIKKFKPLVSGDTLNIVANIDTRKLAGTNSLFIDVNPDNDQPEQYHFNNFLYRNFFVKGDTLNPLLDVTFDGVHILNRDIVSAKPKIIVKLKDESKWMVITDTSVATIAVKYPNGTIREFHFGSDTLQFHPAGQAPNNDNTATIEFNPSFLQDGDYELMVTGKDMSANKAGNVEYRVAFQVINKAMISNMLNYPNPFTSSTAFVFTVTGSDVPQNLKIQIMTITGKIVREITKEELGPIHIGRNITDFKWDGTDQYGQKLANGIYLYRVVTNLNGKSLEKYKQQDDKTDQYFNKGYGKMYLMR